MPHNTMTFQDAVRPGSSSSGCTSVERRFADFQIDERSVLEILVTADGGHSDYMSGFVSGYLEQNLRLADNLIPCDQPQAGPCRVVIYICPECRHRVRSLLSANSQRQWRDHMGGIYLRKRI